MGTSVQPFIDCSVRAAQRGYIIIMAELVLRKRKSRPSISPSMSMTSREMARLMPSTPATSTPPSRPSRPLVAPPRRARSSWSRTKSSPCTRPKESKDQGGFHDFVEILKLYDKNNDDTMLGHELFKMLTNLGEKLTKEEAKSLMKELCEP